MSDQGGEGMKLSQKWIDRLLRLPESGMGYQIVSVTLKNGQRFPRLVVLNSEEIQNNDLFSSEDIESISETVV